MEERLFVYGSLKRGFEHHAELAGAHFIEHARTCPGYELVRVGSYPALVASCGRDGVRGELYAVDDALLARLDEFEDVPASYQRVEIALDRGAPAWCYVMDSDAVLGCERLGDWWAGPA